MKRVALDMKVWSVICGRSKEDHVKSSVVDPSFVPPCNLRKFRRHTVLPAFSEHGAGQSAIPVARSPAQAFP